MRTFSLLIGMVLIFLAGLPGVAWADTPTGIQPEFKLDTRLDMRSDYQVLERQRRQLVKKAMAEKQEALKAAKTQALLIKNDRQALKIAIADLKNSIKNVKTQNKKIRENINNLKKEEDQLNQDLEKTRAVNQEFAGFVSSNAKDLKALLLQSLQSGLYPGRHLFLDPVLGQGKLDQEKSGWKKFPSMDDLKMMTDHLFNEINLSGQVALTSGRIIDRKGKEQEATLLILGNFTGIYQLGNELGFLLYSDHSQQYFALSKLPSPRVTRKIAAYIQGKSDDVHMDISKGGAIRQLAHKLNLAEQVPKGGAIVWPILIILVLAGCILIERIVFFTRRRTNAENLMKTVKERIMADDWEGCRTFLELGRKKLIPKVLLTALAFKDQTRQDMENALQEAILGEIPRIERFLSTLGMLAAIAPLLGLLGTVTGMINTFHVITYYGTGDPRMMSGGISEALVTTMLGLSVAIPIMMAHTFLSRSVETQISKMEEKSVAFVNLVFMKRKGSRQ
jgi:biopolymer transport protein ExbB